MVVCFCGAAHDTRVGYSFDKEEVHHPPALSLASLKSILQEHKSPSFSLTHKVGWSVYKQAMEWIRVQSICLQHLREGIDVAQEALDWLFGEETHRNWTIATVCLGVNVAEAVANRMVGLGVSVTEEWESLIWTIVSLIRKWRPDFAGHTRHSQCLIFWVLCMFTNPAMCSNVYMRLEMLRLVQMWPDKWLTDRYVGITTAKGVLTTTRYLKADDLIGNDLQFGLANPLTRVMGSLASYGHMAPFAKNALTQVNSLRLGQDTHFLAHLVELANEQANMTQKGYLEGYIGVMLTLDSFEDVLYLLKMLVAKPPFMEAFGSPGMAQVAAAAFVSVTSSLLAVGPQLMNNAMIGFTYLVFYNDIMYRSLAGRRSPNSVFLLLRRDHRQELSVMNKIAGDVGCPFFDLPRLYLEGPCGERTESCPERFLDSVTQAVMEAPVLLHSSKMVDESTLIQLLLTSPSDPFTRCPLDPDTFSRLPGLQDDIVAWRKDARVHQDNSNSG
ncbi:Ubiquitin conjugation factor E4 B-like 2 [Homarus americanus]|uniref:Ubiquitin conjugation factor E4 B-like 1 n=1 Tax=Homarus americanus TaxID=6706 RepID=A0A8J5JE13_HOMAM|nr:Ubiquitin conjugation factor E4 B-like 1 [Homarus americanus]KAG7166632.1 Ubiquitin conjugation factor E4 B-like 2 [Homarus americanus]